MAGHSKWANIKRQKNAQDRERGRVFSKLSKLITTAVKEGGSSDPEKNVQLRQAIDRAKEENMPKDSIERAIENAIKKSQSSQEEILEGYGPFGLAVLIKAETDNRQRTVQEIKNIFENFGGNLGEPGSVAYKFNRQGKIVIKKSKEESLLDLIDLGAEDIDEEDNQIIIYVSPDTFRKVKDRVGEKYQLLEAEIELIAQDKLKIEGEDEKKKIKQFIKSLQEHDDVEKVFTNV